MHNHPLHSYTQKTLGNSGFEIVNIVYNNLALLQMIQANLGSIESVNVQLSDVRKVNEYVLQIKNIGDNLSTLLELNDNLPDVLSIAPRIKTFAEKLSNLELYSEESKKAFSKHLQEMQEFNKITKTKVDNFKLEAANTLNKYRKLLKEDYTEYSNCLNKQAAQITHGLNEAVRMIGGIKELQHMRTIMAYLVASEGINHWKFTKCESDFIEARKLINEAEQAGADVSMLRTRIYQDSNKLEGLLDNMNAIAQGEG